VKISNEIKVGILAVVSTVLLIWGYNFLKGKNIFSNDIVCTAIFNAVDGLNIASPVTVNGYKVGAVTAIRPTPDYNKVEVEMNIVNGTKIPNDATAKLVQPSLMGSKEIALIFKGECQDNCLEYGDQLQGDVSGMIDGVLEIADPYLGKIDTILGAISNLSKDEKGQLEETFKDLQGIINNVKILTNLVNTLLARSTKNISGTLSNLESITNNIKDNNEEIGSMLQNLNTVTQQLKDADLQGTVGAAKGALENIDKTVDGLQTTLGKANTALENISKLVDLSNQDGLVAALFNDKQFKGDIDKVIDNLTRLLEDIRIHPERYRTVLSNRYKPYVDPEDDPKLKDKDKK